MAQDSFLVERFLENGRVGIREKCCSMIKSDTNALEWAQSMSTTDI